MKETVRMGKKYKIVYCTPALYMAGGVERVLTLKANYFAEELGYDITIILTEGYNLPAFYPLSDKVKLINLNIGFEKLWECSFVKKILVYLYKQYLYKNKLKTELERIKPDITISLLRREINFLTKIHDGSKKIGEIHVNKSNYRNFEENDSNIIKKLFSICWMKSLVAHLKQLDKFVVLTNEDKAQWQGLRNIAVIPDPLSFKSEAKSQLTQKRVIAVGRYVYQKGFDLLLSAWSKIEDKCEGWELVIYGQGDRAPYERIIDNLCIDRDRCHLCGKTNDIDREYLNSSIFVLSSRFEGFGMVLVEAMECGLPIVSFDCPCGPKDIITNGIDGVLVENGNVDVLAEKLLQLINSSEMRKKLSENAINKANDYSIEYIALRWKVLFDSLMSEE